MDYSVLGPHEARGNCEKGEDQRQDEENLRNPFDVGGGNAHKVAVVERERDLHPDEAKHVDEEDLDSDGDVEDDHQELEGLIGELLYEEVGFEQEVKRGEEEDVREVVEEHGNVV